MQLFSQSIKELHERRRRNSSENKTISTDVLRKQYRELWQLRATFEAEELDTSNPSGDAVPQIQQIQQKLTKNDSGIEFQMKNNIFLKQTNCFVFRI